MAAPILWAPGKIAFFLQEKPMPIFFWGGGILGLGGGGSADFIFKGARIFLVLVVIVLSKLFRACLYGVLQNYRAICSKMGYRTDLSGVNTVPRRGIAPFWGPANLPEKVLRDMGYRSNSIAIWCDMGPLRGKFRAIFRAAQIMKCKPWTERLAKKGLSRQVSRRAWKRRIKPWIRGKNGAQTVI